MDIPSSAGATPGLAARAGGAWDVPGPARLVVVRHGESLGNVADAEAHRHQASRLTLDVRDADVELSATGRDQADALGRWWAGSAGPLPDAVLSSPFRRAFDTARRALAQLPGHDAQRLQPIRDERLRERDLGAFDGMTGLGIRTDHPDEARRRTQQGKFYYRPPGGESWCDVALRVRSLLRDVDLRWPGGHVWLFTHRAVIMNLRLVLEDLDEDAVLRADAEEPLANCAVTTYARDGGRLRLESYNATPAVDAGAAKTHEPESAGRLTGAEPGHHGG
ncbi:MAG: histidine phosphatase family protein [Kineosporiaceae bacterium]